MKIKLIALILAAGSAYADDAENIETISISTTRLNPETSQLPSNLASLSEESLALISHQHINQSLQRIAGVWVSRGNGQEHLTAIRSPVLTGAGGCGAFFIAEDGIGVRAPYFCNTNQLFDINSEQAASVEVLRGPASTLYGSNALHGVINVLSPSAFAVPELSISLELGENEYLRSNIATSTQQDNQAFAVLASLTQDGGYKDDSGFDQQKFSLIHEYQGDVWQVKNYLSGSNLNQETAGFIQGFEAYKDDALKKLNPNPEAFRDSQSLRAYSRWQQTTRRDNQITITPYFRWTDMRFLQHFLPWQAEEENSQSSVGIQSQYLQTFSWGSLLTGFDIDLSQGELTEFQAQPFSPAIPEGLHYDYQVDTQVLSPFVKLIWQANQRMQFDIGLRYDDSRFDYDNFLTDGDACAPDVSGCRFSRPQDQVRHYREWSADAGVSYQLASDQQVYAKLAQGYRAPQATELFRLQAGQRTTDLDAETLTSAELGLVGAFQQLSYNLSVFAMQKDNFIFQDTERQNISDGETQHQGIELALTYDINQAWKVSGNVSWAEHQYSNDIAISNASIRDNDIDTAPNTQGGLQLSWQPNNTFTSELEWVHMGSYYLNPENSAKYDGHDLVHWRSRYQLNAQASIGLTILNLTDEDYAERADFAFGNYRYFVGEPRSVFVSIEITH